MGSCMPEYQTATDEQVEGRMKAPPGLAPIPVANFDPCGESPTAGREIDQSLSGQPLGTCSGSFSGIAYQHPTVTMDDELVGSTVDVKRNPDPIDKLGYLGCFRDNDGGRTLEQYFGNGFTPKTCRAKVQSESSTHIVFALQYGGQCRASASATAYRGQGLSADCTMTCSANKLLICGGPNPIRSTKSIHWLRAQFRLQALRPPPAQAHGALDLLVSHQWTGVLIGFVEVLILVTILTNTT